MHVKLNALQYDLNLAISEFVYRAGFVIFYDLVMGLEATLGSVHLLAGLYCNGEKLGQTTPMPPVQCQPLLSTKSPENYAILAFKQPVPR